MLDLARTKACYDQLNCAELGHYLSQQQAQFDLICALDVLIYQGKLGGIVFAVGSTVGERRLVCLQYRAG